MEGGEDIDGNCIRLRLKAIRLAAGDAGGWDLDIGDCLHRRSIIARQRPIIEQFIVGIP